MGSLEPWAARRSDCVQPHRNRAALERSLVCLSSPAPALGARCSRSPSRRARRPRVGWRRCRSGLDINGVAQRETEHLNWSGYRGRECQVDTKEGGEHGAGGECWRHADNALLSALIAPIRLNNVGQYITKQESKECMSPFCHLRSRTTHFCRGPLAPN